MKENTYKVITKSHCIDLTKARGCRVSNVFPFYIDLILER